MNPVAIVTLLNTLLGTATQLLPTIQQMTQDGLITPEQQAEILSKYQSLKTQADGQFQGPEWQLLGPLTDCQRAPHAMLLKLLLVRVPDFYEAARKENKPNWFFEANEREKEKHLQERANALALVWACATAAAAFNIALITGLAILLVKGTAVLNALFHFMQ